METVTTYFRPRVLLVKRKVSDPSERDSLSTDFTTSVAGPFRGTTIVSGHGMGMCTLVGVQILQLQMLAKIMMS
jgi:hypothetical protein